MSGSSLPSKRAVYDALRARVQARLGQMRHAAQEAAEGATHAEARSEGDKDMRATEQSYVARGQALRVESLGEALLRLDGAPWPNYGVSEESELGALLAVELAGERRVFILLDHSGGEIVIADGVTVTVVTRASPVGAELFARRVGDFVEVPLGARTLEGEITDIR